MSIRIEKVSFSYGKRHALKSLDFTLASSVFNALLGPNGAGKSTLFSLITRLNALQTGDIRLNDLSIRSQPAALMRQVGVVFQQSTLDLDLTVTQNLLYHAALHGMSSRQARLRIDEELARMHMAERASEKVRDLNGGHRRRVEIARSLLHQPSILLLDEPTVGLDPQTRLSLNERVRGLCSDTGLTVLWATHLIEEVREDDPVILLHQGQVILHDSAACMLARSGESTLTRAFHALTGGRSEVVTT